MSNTTDQIQQQFVAYLGRPATSTELDQWLADAAQAGPDAALASLHAQVTTSAELGARFFGIEPGDMINQVYEGLFGTRPTTAEFLQYLYTSSGLAIESDPVKVIDTALAQATPTEKAVLADKVEAADAFTATVPAGADSAHTLGHHFLDGVTDDASLAAALAQAHGALVGGDGDDALTGTAGNDWLFGAAGNDTLAGGAGNDVFDAGTYSPGIFGSVGDVVRGGAGDDTLLVAGNVADYLRGHDSLGATLLSNPATGEQITLTDVEHVAFRDGLLDIAEVQHDGRILVGTRVNDVFVVTDPSDLVVERANGGGADEVHVALTEAGRYVVPDNVEKAVVTAAPDVAVTLVANAHGSTLVDNGGANTLLGSDSEDLLFSGGHDLLSGGRGDDTYFNAVDGTTIVEAADSGVDTVYASGPSYTLSDNVENLWSRGENATWGEGDFVGIGNASDNTIFSENGNDRLEGRGGNDWLFGADGDDVLDGGDGNDELDGDYGRDLLIGGAGNDILRGYYGVDRLDGGDGDDLLDAGPNVAGYGDTTTDADFVDGGAGTDTLQLIGNFADYVITRPTPTSTALVNPNTFDSVIVRNVEYVEFADGVKSIAEVNQGIAAPTGLAEVVGSPALAAPDVHLAA